MFEAGGSLQSYFFLRRRLSIYSRFRAFCRIHNPCTFRSYDAVANQDNSRFGFTLGEPAPFKMTPHRWKEACQKMDFRFRCMTLPDYDAEYLALWPRQYFPCLNEEDHTGCKYFEPGSEAYEWCERQIYHAEDVADMLAKPSYLQRSRKYCAEKIAEYEDPRWLEWEFVVGQCIKQEP